MRLFIRKFGMLSIGIWFWGCLGSPPKRATPSYAARTDFSGLADRIRIGDSASWNFRWIEFPRARGESGLGPTDTRLVVLATRKDSTTGNDDSDETTGEIDLPVKIADSLLPPEIVSLGRMDSAAWAVRGTTTRSPFEPKSWYGSGPAIRMGRSILMEFDSH